jgi:hypothetical protein
MNDEIFRAKMLLIAVEVNEKYNTRFFTLKDLEDFKTILKEYIEIKENMEDDRK